MVLLIAGSPGREASAAVPRPASARQPGRTQGDTSWWEAAESLLQKERRQYSTSQLTPDAVQELQVKGQQVTKLLNKLVSNRVQHGLDPSVSWQRGTSRPFHSSSCWSAEGAAWLAPLRDLPACIADLLGIKGSQVSELQCWAAALTTKLGKRRVWPANCNVLPARDWRKAVELSCLQR